MNIQQFWSDVLAQRADEIREYFQADAYVNWHCSNEHFTVEEFIRANCEYPGDWDGEVEKTVLWTSIGQTMAKLQSGGRIWNNAFTVCASTMQRCSER